MKKNIKLIILLIIIFIIVDIIAILVIRNNLNESEQKENKDVDLNLSQDLNPIKEIYEVDNIYEYYAIKNALKNFSNNFNDEDKEILYNTIDENYIDKNNITVDNILSKINFTDNENAILIMNRINKNDSSINVKSYYINYCIYDINKYLQGYNQNECIIKNDCNIVLNYDAVNKTFSLIPDYNENSNFNSIESIDRNNDNEFVIRTLNEKETAVEYFNIYRDTVLIDLEKSYLLLNEEYRNKRFGSIEKYNEFVNSKRDQYVNDVFVGYEDNFSNETISYEADDKKDVDTYEEGEEVYIEDYVQYVLKDSYNNYFIIYEKSFNDYSIMLDRYTIPDDMFKNKYSRLSDNSKANTCVDTFIQMINSKDYDAAYKMLDETFKNNNFGNVENFTNYMQSNLFNVNYLNIYNVEEKEGIYILKAYIRNSSNSNYEEIEKNFIVKLESGTDFVISFNIN